jgi:PAS domain S-box-containing protein
MFIQSEHQKKVIDQFPGLLPIFQAGIRSLVAIPMITKDEVIGVLHLQSCKPNAYVDKDLSLAERVGNQIAGAIANAQLFVERKRAEEALRKSEERFRELYDSAPVGYHELDSEGRITQVNRTEQEMLGYTTQEILGQPAWKFIAEEEESHQAVLAELAGAVSASKAFERTYRRKDGTTLPVIIEDRLLRDREGRVTGIRSTMQDITHHKRAEDALRESEDRYRDLVEYSQYLICTHDLKGRILSVNQKGARLLGYEQRDLLNKNIRDLLVLEVRVGFDTYLDTIQKDGVAKGLMRMQTTTGEKRIWEYNNTLRTEGVTAPIVRAIAHDITEHLRAEEAVTRLSQENAIIAEIGRIVSSTLNIEEVYERFAEEVHKVVAFDRIVINIIDIEKATVINVYMAGNEIMDRKEREVYPLEGSGNAEMVRMNSTLLIQTEDFNEYKDRFPMLLSTFQAGFRSIMNVPLFSKGRIIGGLLLRSLKPYAYADKDVRLAERIGNQIAGAIANAQLFIERKRTEEALRRNQEELLKKNEEIEASRKNLQLALEELEGAYKELKATQSKILQQEKMASIGQLAAGVAHEINNPMAFISSNLGTLDKYVNRLTEFIQTQSEVIEALHMTDAIEGLKRKQKELKLDYITEDIKGLITESLDGSERVRKIVLGLKSFARVDEAEYKYANINECIESTINIVWNELKYKATLKKDYGNLPLTKCYPQQINQVFMNLLINAGHAIESQGEITIKTWAEDGSILIAISDTGYGISKEDLNKIFEPFFTTKEVGKGTGLGLSITYEIVKKHDGEITVESEVGKGTTFTVRLPIV